MGPGPELRAVALFSSAEPRREWGLRLGPRVRPTGQRPGVQIQAPSNLDAHHTSPEPQPRIAKSTLCGATARPLRSRSRWPGSRSKYPRAGTGLQGGREDRAPQAGAKPPKCERDPGGASARCARLVERVGGVEVHGGRTGPGPSPVAARWAQGLDISAGRASLSRATPELRSVKEDDLRRARYRG